MNFMWSELIILLHSIGVTCITTMWHRSSLIGTNIGSNVMDKTLSRSKVECLSTCSSNVNCESAQYDIQSRWCTLLSSSNQAPPFTSNNDLMHFSTNLISDFTTQQASTILSTTQEVTTQETTVTTQETTVTTQETTATTNALTTSATCPSGYYHMPTSNICLKYVEEWLSYSANRAACISDGSDLPVLDTAVIFADFQNYMDNIVNAVSRVVLNGKLYNFEPKWETTGSPTIDPSKFCNYCPDEPTSVDICVYMAHKSETWCGSSVNRLDDASCAYDNLRICMIKL